MLSNKSGSSTLRIIVCHVTIDFICFSPFTYCLASPRQTAAGQHNHVARPIKNRFHQSYRMHQNSPFELSNQKILWGPLLVGRGHPFPTQYPLGVNSLSHLLMSYCFLNTVAHFMVVVLYLGLFDVRTKNTTQKERLVPKSVTLNDLERRNGLYFALFLPN